MSSQSLNILITGGAGFIGTHLARHCQAQGHQVTSWDLREPKNRVEGVTYLLRDVRKLSSFAIELLQFDLIYHLAAIVSIPLCQQDPQNSFATNVDSTQQMMTYLQKGQKKTPVLFASSSAVYGELGSEKETLSENLHLGAPLSLYAAQKRFCEDLLRCAKLYESYPCLSLRFFNVYGPDQDRQSPYSGVMTLFSQAAQEGSPLKIFGDGSATRDFVHVQDITRACLEAGFKLLDRDKELKDIHVLNVGTGGPTTIDQLADFYVVKSANRSQKQHLALRPGDALHSCADVKLFERIFAWRPRSLSKEWLV